MNLGGSMNEGEFIDYDISEIPAFSQNETELVERLKVADWLSVNEKRERMSLLPQDGDEFNLPMVMLSGRVNHGDLDADGNLDSNGTSQTNDDSSENSNSDDEDKESSEERNQQRKEKIAGSTTVLLERKRKRSENDFRQGISQIFAIEQNKVMDAIESVKDTSTMLVMAELAIKDNRGKWVDGLIVNVAKTAYEFAIVTGKMIKAADNKFDTDNGLEDERLLALALLLDFEALDLDDLGEIENTSISQNISTLIKQYVINNEVSGSIDSIQNTSINRVKSLISAAALAGISLDEIRDSIDELYLSFQDGRTNVIAETEVIKASNLGVLAAGLSLGKQTKKWITMGDNKVRVAHVLANGRSVGINESFIVGGEMLSFPGDGSKGASPDNIINCRCQLGIGE